MGTFSRIEHDGTPTCYEHVYLEGAKCQRRDILPRVHWSIHFRFRSSPRNPPFKCWCRYQVCYVLSPFSGARTSETKLVSLICLVCDQARDCQPLPPRRVPVTTRCCPRLSQSSLAWAPPSPQPAGGSRIRLGGCHKLQPPLHKCRPQGDSSNSHRNPPRRRIRSLVGDT